MNSLWQILYNLIFDYTLRTVALGTGTLGIVSGALGTYTVLRKQSLLGDAMSHAALPGVVLAFMLTRSKAPLVLILGATVAGWIGTLLVMSVINNTRIKDDSAMGLVLSVFFGFGLMLLTFVQRTPNANQAGLDKFLFGQAAALLQQDVVTMAIISGVDLVLMGIFWKEFKLLSFDPEFGTSLGFPMRWLDVLLTTLIVIAIVIGLQAVGVVLMSAMVVAPAAAARQWTNHMYAMVILSALFGALAGVSGAVISSTTTGLSTGPTIVLSISAIVLVSLFFAANRGLAWRWIQSLHNQRILQVEAVLLDLYTLASKHGDLTHGHPAAILHAMHSGAVSIERSLRELEARGWACCAQTDNWTLTEAGWKEAERIANARRGTQ
ncbi:MAG: metal ABC transporter permease [Anaerolineae bacterium]|nr:metal ABC transporter permease [Anaerolineae bacterium]